MLLDYRRIPSLDTGVLLQRGGLYRSEKMSKMAFRGFYQLDKLINSRSKGRLESSPTFSYFFPTIPTFLSSSYFFPTFS